MKKTSDELGLLVTSSDVLGLPVTSSDVLGLPVTSSDGLGLPVTSLDGLGLPVTSSYGLGLPVTSSDGLGLPVTSLEVVQKLFIILLFICLLVVGILCRLFIDIPYIPNNVNCVLTGVNEGNQSIYLCNAYDVSRSNSSTVFS